MSDNTVDYNDKRVDAGGDKAYDSSNYGTTTGDLTENAKHSSGDFGSGRQASNAANTQSKHPGLRASGQDVVNHEQWGENEGKAGQSGGTGTDRVASSAPSEDKELTSDDARVAQGYTKSGDMNPEIGA